MKSPKTDPFHRGCTMLFGGHNICPAAALSRYLAIRGTTPGPVFMRADSLSISPFIYISHRFWLMLRSVSFSRSPECRAITQVTVFHSRSWWNSRSRPLRLLDGGLVTVIYISLHVSDQSCGWELLEVRALNPILQLCWDGPDAVAKPA